MIETRHIRGKLLMEDYEISEEEAIEAVGHEAYNYLERAANRQATTSSRIKNFIQGENEMGRKLGLITDLAMFFLPSGVRSGREAVQRIITKEEKPMPVLKDKPWYQSKTIWSAVLIIITGVLQALDVDVAANPAAVETVYQVLYTVAGAFGLYGLRDAIAQKSEKIEGKPAES